MERGLFADKVNDVLFTNEKKQEIFLRVSVALPTYSMLMNKRGSKIDLAKII